jgi:uncharacterized protein (TIGR00251 family)
LSHLNPWFCRGAELILHVKVTPKAKADEILTVRHEPDGRALLIVRVKALPQDGEANAAVLRLFSKALGLPLSAVRLEAGHTNRFKTLALRGDLSALQQQLSSFLA